MTDEITKDNIEQPVEIVTPSEVIPEPIIQTVEPEIESVPEKVSIPDTVPEPISEPVAPVITEQPEETLPIITETPLIPLSGEVEPSQAPIIVPTENPAPIIITPAPEPVISEPVAVKPVEVSSSATIPPAPLSTLDRISLAFKNNMLHARELLVKAHAVVSARRRKKIDSIMNLFLTKKKIKNSDVRDLLHITDETATVYLNILKKEGKIQQTGARATSRFTKV